VRKWHFQFVHHPLWDHDMSSAPLLIDTTIDGKPRKIVAVPSKQGWLYCFDRITGVPIWPIEEKPVPQTTMKHEQTSPTQPFPSKPVPYARTYIAESDLIDFTPTLRTQALANLKFFRWEPTPYVPPTGPESKLLGALNIGNTAGGTNWPGAGFDVETGIFYSQAGMTNVTAGHYSEEEFAKVTPENKGTMMYG
jgi:quinoprotein glucose dehydrogenase